MSEKFDWKTLLLLGAGVLVKIFTDLNTNEKRETKIKETTERWLENKFKELEMKTETTSESKEVSE